MELNEKEKLKFQVIEKVINEEITKKEATDILDVTIRTINRLILKYETEGEEGFVHKSRGTESYKKIPDYIRQDIVDLYLDEYFDYNIEHYSEICESRFGHGYSTIYGILRAEDVISPMAHKKTKDEYFKNMKQKEKQLSEEKQEIYQTRLIEDEYARSRKTSKNLKFGEILEMDACVYTWFGKIESHIHLIVDVATKKVLFGWFSKEELTRTYFILLFNTIINYGIPYTLKTDNRSSFKANNSQNKDTINTTQIGRICQTLGIKLRTSSNPTFKPHVERENGVFKGRLVAELRHEGITTYDKANKYLNEVFIPYINNKFSFDVSKDRIMFKENKYTIEELNNIFSDRWKRTIDNASSIKFKNIYYVPIDDNGNVVSYKNKTECIFMYDYNYEPKCIIENNVYKLKEIEERPITPKSKIVSIEPKEKKVYIPSKNHPWRNFKV